METIHVVEAFMLNLPAGPKQFEVGEHEVSKEEAEHWYTRLHVQKAKPKAEPKTKKPDDDEGRGAKK